MNYQTKEEQTAFYKSKDWQLTRAEVLRRDNYECQWCKREGRVTDRSVATLEVDHREELEKRPDLALDLENLRTLCRSCHNKRHKRFGPGSNRKHNKWDGDEKW